MANLRDINRRIKSVKNTAQITRAMQLVAASKMKKAQDQATSGRAYADLMNRLLVNLRENIGDEEHPLLTEREGKELIVVISSDKGLCGALNTNLFRLAMEEASDGAAFVTVGIKGKQFLARQGKNLLADFPLSDPLEFAESKQLSQFIIEQYTEGEFSTVKVAFTNFINTIRQEPMVETLLPVRPIDLGRDKSYVGMGEEPEQAEGQSDGPEYGGYIFEPSATAVLDTIVPQYVDYEVYQMILESRASEHSARMVAMKNATDNAKTMIKDLTLEYNKQRQAAITAELLEITTAMKALE